MAADSDLASKKTALVDSSSAIILYKSGLVGPVIDHYFTVISESVYAELTRKGYSGAEAFRRYCHEKKICVRGDVRGINNDADYSKTMAGLGAGERDTIMLYHSGIGEFIIIDDGRGARYCKKNGIPHINALLMPRLLYNAGKIDGDDRNHFMDIIIGYGRYSPRVIDYARTSDDKELIHFL